MALSAVYSGVVLLIVGALLGAVLAVASKKFYVEVDERVETVNSLLPGYNCGACGCPGCIGMAEKLVANTINLKACKPAKEEVLLEIQKYLKDTPDSSGNGIDVKM